MRHQIAVAALLVTAAGCVAPTPPPTSTIIEHKENLKTEVNQARLVDPVPKVVNTTQKVVVHEVRTQTLQGLLRADFILKNNGGKREVVNYRLRWLDQNGMVISQYDPWETVGLDGHEQSVLTVGAPSPAATDFRLELRSND